MKRFLLYLWQLPQNILGLLVIFFTQAKHAVDIWCTYKYRFGVSLGSYIIFGGAWYTETDIKHEKGHQKQSQYLGVLYLFVIGIPSAIGNIYDRKAHGNWTSEERRKWYYSLPWEAWADRLGGVER